MYSRRLEEYHLLNRLSRIEEVRLESSIKRQAAKVEEPPIVGKSIPEAMAVYMSREASQTASRAAEPKLRQNQNDSSEKQNMLEVVEIYRIANRRKEDAKEQQEKASTVKREHVSEQPVEDDLAYERLDCSRGASYLLYSYNEKGTHSLLGKDVRPGHYGGHITTGEFYRKA